MIATFIFTLFAAIQLVLASQHPHFKTAKAPNPDEVDPIYWINNAQEAIKSKLKIELNNNVAKNVIFFIGDGMDLTTVNAARVYMSGNEEKALFFENFPHTGLSVTYCVDRKVADSACSSTAFLTGVKANYGTIGMNANMKRYDCNAYANAVTHTESILRWAQLSGKSTGIVTNTRVTHATPAGAYAHSAERYWESDADVKESQCDPNVVPDIAQQLINSPTGQQLKVVMGGGRRMFLDETFTDEEGGKGSRTDGRNLIEEWQNLQRVKQRKFNYVWNKSQLQRLDLDNTDYVLGLFETDHCHYNLDIRNQNLDDEPTLAEMVEVAVKLLENNEKGYFLFVEGGKIDMAHHSTKAHYVMEETAELARAVEKAFNITKQEDTLIVVSADHGHAVMYNGYGVSVLCFSIRAHSKKFNHFSNVVTTFLERHKPVMKTYLHGPR